MSRPSPGIAVLASPDAWSRTFPGTLGQVGEARRFLRAILNGHPATDNAVSSLSEISANAIQHSRTAQPGGTFHVRFRRSGAAIRIEVTDNGGPWATRPRDPEHGRGLRMVQTLTDRQGITIQGPAGNPHQRTVWCEIGAP